MRITLALWISLALSACAADKARTPNEKDVAATQTSAVKSDNERLSEFFEDAFMENVMRVPTFQGFLGMKTNQDKWNDLSEAFLAEGLDIAKRQLAEIHGEFDYDSLTPKNQLSYRLFVEQREEEIADYKYRHHGYPVNQMFGAQSGMPSFLINIHRIDAVSDAENYIARLVAIEAQMDQVIENLKIREDKGVLAPRFVYPYVIKDSHNVIIGAPFDDSGKDSTLLADFTKKVGELDIDENEKAELIESARQALVEQVKPGYEALIAHVEGMQSRANDDDGAWKLPDGAAFYENALRRTTTTDYSAERIHEIGLAEVARIHDEMRAIMKDVGFDGSLQDFFAYTRDNERFYYDETEAGKARYLEEATAIIDDMRARLDELFITKPKADLIVKAVEPFREESAGKAFYQRPAPDGSRPGTYYANLFKMSAMPVYQMEALAYHEGIPGHHMQLAIAQELEDIPKFRKFGGYTAYTEGWGLYSELVPKEIGLYEDPYSDFGRLAMELWRACRLVVDTGIHDQRWTRQQAIDYLAENTPNPHSDVVKAIERYIVIPGQATAYKIGMIKIVELRENARAALGARFDIREFHEVVLRNGAVPLSVLESFVDEYIEKNKS